MEVLTTYLRMDVMLQLFKEFATPQQKELAAKVEQNGGDAALSKKVMENLACEEYKITNPLGSQNDSGRYFDFVELEQEIKGDPDKAIEKYPELYILSQIRKPGGEIQDIVRREGD